MVAAMKRPWLYEGVTMVTSGNVGSWIKVEALLRCAVSLKGAGWGWFSGFGR